MRRLWSTYRQFMQQASGGRDRTQSSLDDNEAGLTLIECLAAIVVVGLIGAAIAPVLVVSVATRVQSQKSEQALALAQGQIDRARVLLEQGSNADVAAAKALFPPDTAAADITLVAAPTASATPVTTDNALDAIGKTLAVDIDNDQTYDFAVQRFRKEAGSVSDGFYVGVRVYDYQAVTGGATLSRDDASLGLTAGPGDRTAAPLASLYSSVFDSAEGVALCNYIDFSAPAAGNPSGKDKPLGCQ